jgi:intracellular sulfur oxidation DsrE/DsrF family protein
MKKLLFILLTLALIVPAYAAAPASISGLDTAKFVVDLNQGDGKKLRLRLSLILETIENIEKYGVKADVVVAVRGVASEFMMDSRAMLDDRDAEIQKDVYALINKLSEKGVRLEQCAVALRLLKISPSEIIPKLTVVENGYVSLIGYQNKGYALLPME